jgi:hypothetical protein
MFCFVFLPGCKCKAGQGCRTVIISGIFGLSGLEDVSRVGREARRY